MKARFVFLRVAANLSAKKRIDYEEDLSAKQDQACQTTWFSCAYGYSWRTRHNQTQTGKRP